jgi:hypothetical protein
MSCETWNQREGSSSKATDVIAVIAFFAGEGAARVGSSLTAFGTRRSFLCPFPSILPFTASIQCQYSHSLYQDPSSQSILLSTSS